MESTTQKPEQKALAKSISEIEDKLQQAQTSQEVSTLEQQLAIALEQMLRQVTAKAA